MDRRSFLTTAGVALAATALPRAVAQADPLLAPFTWGVASGDPAADRVILWTRVDPASAPAGADVAWVVAADPALTAVVAAGTAFADPARDHCVKVDATGLQARTTYFYGFTALGKASLTGRTRTAPSGPVDKLRIAVVTCSNYPQGFFNAYRTLAERDDLDVVLHTGDYLYESGQVGTVGRPASGGVELVTLEQYRARYAQYHLDPDLRLLHQRHPFITIWDDHETCNDSYRDGALNHDPATDGDWFVRKAAGQRAYDEWLPIRLPEPGNTNRIFRTAQYGDLADLVMLDTRLYGRDKQAAGSTNQYGTPGNVRAEVDDPARTILGLDQEQWLMDQLRASVTAGRTWRVVVQQVMFAQLNAVGLPDNANQTFLPAGGVALNPDQWDGYTASRQRLFDALDGTNPTLGLDGVGAVPNVVVVAGDFHASFASDCAPDVTTPWSPATPQGYTPGAGLGTRAVEFVTPSVTSTNFDEQYGLAAAMGVGGVITAANRHIKYNDVINNGYVMLTLTPDRAQGDYWFVDTVLTPSAVETVSQSWYAEPQSALNPFPHLLLATAPATPSAAQQRPPADPPAVAEQPADMPEVPAAALLPVVAAGALAAGIALRNRRRPSRG